MFSAMLKMTFKQAIRDQFAENGVDGALRDAIPESAKSSIPGLIPAPESIKVTGSTTPLRRRS
jgi:hypothetical protein